MTFRIGHHPETSNMVIQAGDAAAKETCKQIADLISDHLNWKVVFPFVAPDRNKGWGMNGYEVRRLDLSYDDWRALTAKTKGKDPTLLGLGYKSRAMIGKHPTGVLLIDDIHDENNTRSGRELEMVRQVLTGTILPTVTAETWQVVVGTPWVGDDILAYLKATRRYLNVRTPVLAYGRERDRQGEQIVLDPAEVDPAKLVLEVALEPNVPADQGARIEVAATAARELGFSRMRALTFISKPDPAFVLEETRRKELADLEHQLRIWRLVGSGH